MWCNRASNDINKFELTLLSETISRVKYSSDKLRKILQGEKYIISRHFVGIIFNITDIKIVRLPTTP